MMIRFRYHFVSRIPCSLAYFHSASASLSVLNVPKNAFAASMPTTPLSVTFASDFSFSLIPETAA